MTEIRIAVQGEGGTSELWRWLTAEVDLRGSLKFESGNPRDGAMGMEPEIVALFSASTTTALVQCLRAWIAQRRSHAVMIFTGPEKRSVKVDVTNVSNLTELLQSVSELLGKEGSPPLPVNPIEP